MKEGTRRPKNPETRQNSLKGRDETSKKTREKREEDKLALWEKRPWRFLLSPVPKIYAAERVRARQGHVSLRAGLPGVRFRVFSRFLLFLSSIFGAFLWFFGVFLRFFWRFRGSSKDPLYPPLARV